MTEPELKPCPFCGGNKTMVFPPNCTERGPYNRGDNAQPVVRCMTCFAEAMGKAWDDGMASAIAAWNTRSTAEADARVLAAVEACDKAMKDTLSYIDKGRYGMARNIIAAAIRARVTDVK